MKVSVLAAVLLVSLVVVLTSAQQLVHPSEDGRTCQQCRRIVINRCLGFGTRLRSRCQEKADQRCAIVCQTTTASPTTTPMMTTSMKPFCKFRCGGKSKFGRRGGRRRGSFRRGQGSFRRGFSGRRNGGAQQ